MKLLKLENRIVLDAAAVIEAAQHTASLPVATPAVESQPLEIVADQQQPVVAEVVAALSLEPVSSDGLNIALVANNLNNYAELTDSLTAQGVTVITFDTQTDSSEALLQQVEALAVQQNSTISSLSVVSHGGGGRFSLGNEMVTAESLAQDTSAWSALRDNFSENSAVYLFGCNVVDGSGRGQALLDNLAAATGSDLFASNDLTGVGGDWILEASSAGADAQLATPDSRMLLALAGFEGTLANTPPVVVVPGAQSVNEDLVLAVAGISVSDLDVSPAQEAVRVVEVTLNVTNLNGVTVSDGLLTLNQTANITFTPSAVNVVSDGIADSQMSFLGTISDVNLALASLSFQGAQNFNGDLLVQVSVNDRGNIDTAIDIAVDPNQIGAFLTTTASFGVTVVAVNDAPTVSVPTVIPIAENTSLSPSSLTFSGVGGNTNAIQIGDVDIQFDQNPNLSTATTPLEVTLTAANGTLSLASTTGLTMAAGNTPTLITFSASLDSINTALASGLTFIPTVDLNGIHDPANPNLDPALASFSISVNDQNVTVNGSEQGGTLLPGGGVGGASDGITNPPVDVRVDITPVNSAPVSSVPTGTITIPEDQAVTFDGLGTNPSVISVNDVDLGAGSLTVTLSVPAGSGVLTVSASPLQTVTGDGTNTVTLTGSIADINTALNGLTYTPAANFNGAINLSVTNTDNALTSVDLIALNVLSVNDAPTHALPTANLNVVEDGQLIFDGVGNNPTAIVVSDAEIGQGQGIMAVSLGVSSGALTLSTTQGLSVVGDGSASIVFSGTVPAINAALLGLTYAPALNFNGSVDITIVTNDQNDAVVQAQGSGAGVDVSSSLALSVTAVNDLPVNTVPTGTFNVAEDTPLVFNGIGTNPTAITVNDVDLGAGVLHVTLGVPLNSGTLTVSSSPNLQSVAGNGSNSVILIGTSADINIALDGLIFTPAANFNSAFSLSIVSDDQSGNVPIPSVVSLNVTAINDAPVLVLPAVQTVAEDTLLTFNGISISDVDVGVGVMQVSLALGNGQTPAQGTLNLTNTTNLTVVTGTPAIGSSITFNGSLTDINNALAALTYTPNLNYNGSDQLSITVSDGGNTGSGGVLSANGLIDINVTAVNDAPVVIVPGAQSINEDTDLPISGISISDVDVDAGNGLVSVSLSAGSGVLSLTQSAGVNFSVGTGNQDSGMTFSGTLLDVNAALASVVFYRPNLNFNGSDSIVVTVNDQGNSGAGGALSDSATIAVNVIAVNDAPVLTLPVAQTVAEDSVLALNSISVADTDAGAGLLEITLTLGDALTPAHGALILAGTNGLNFAPGSSASGSAMTFSGNLADINNALGTLSYSGDLNFNGSDRLNISVNDGGSAGSGGSLSDSGVVAIEVRPVNDAPVLIVPGILAVNEDVVVGVNGVKITDVDAGITPLSVTLSANNGMLSLGSVSGLTFATGSSASGASITFSGQLADVNAALAALSYRGNANFFGSDSITVTVSDQGGGGAPLSDSRVIAVDVSPINDAPAFTLSTSALSYSEGGLAVVLDAGLILVDVDNASLQGAKVALGNVQQGDLLAFTSSANVSGSYDAAKGILTLTADPILGATAADFQTVLQSVTYINTLNSVPVGLRPIVFTATDGIGVGTSSTLILSVNNGFTATSSSGSSGGVVTPADPRPPLNGIQIATGGLAPIPSSSIGLLGGVNLSTGAPQGAQLSPPSNASGGSGGAAGPQFLGVQSVRAGGDAFLDECSLDKIFKRVDMGCRFAAVQRGFEDIQYLSVASGQEAGWNYPMSGENQGLIDQLAVGSDKALGLNQSAGEFAEAYLGELSNLSDRLNVPVGIDTLPPEVVPQPVDESGSSDEAVDNAVELFGIEPAAGAAVNIQPLAPLSEVNDELQFDGALIEIDASRSEDGLILDDLLLEDNIVLEDEPLPADVELSPNMGANVQILGRAADLLDKGSLG